MAEFPKTDEALYAAGYRFKNNSYCNSKKCAAEIQWWTTPNNKSIPLNHPTLEPHWSTCVSVNNYRKNKSKSTKLEKRTWVYVQRPKEYEIAFHGCGHTDPDWSEYQRHLWCPKCKVDFIPTHGGIFDGPIAIEAMRLIGISFDRYNLKTKQIEPFELQKVSPSDK